MKSSDFDKNMKLYGSESMNVKSGMKQNLKPRMKSLGSPVRKAKAGKLVRGSLCAHAKGGGRSTLFEKFQGKVGQNTKTTRDLVTEKVFGHYGIQQDVDALGQL